MLLGELLASAPPEEDGSEVTKPELMMKRTGGCSTPH